MRMHKGGSGSSILSQRNIFRISGEKVLGKKLERVIPYKNIRKHFRFVYEKKEE